MFPEGFIKRIKTQEYIEAESLLNALQEPSPVSIRINPSKWNRKPFGSKPVPWCTTGYYLDNRPSFTLDPLFHSGCYYPQEASGMFIEQVLRQIECLSGYLRVLDLCAAPGGKSTHLSSLIGSQGLLVANEVIRARASVLAENISKWGVANTIITQDDPMAFSGLPGFFDIILVDAPCSGEGMFRDHIAVKEWSVGKSFHCSERQKRILADVWPALKENGILIYSTCTFNPFENEENVKWMVNEKRAEIVELDISGLNGITEIDIDGMKSYGFHPGMIRGDGLFISVLRKTDDTVGNMIPAKTKQTYELKRADLEILQQWTTFPSENIIRINDEIFYFPGRKEDIFKLQTCLRILQIGTRICTIKKNSYRPGHELALSDGLRKEAFPVSELNYNQAVAYLRRDNFFPSDIQKGWFLTTYKGVNLGFGNNIGNRVNNYFPVDWRIRMYVPETERISIINWDEN